MSDTEQPKITKEHVKNPKRVAAGKRLAFLRAEKRRLAEVKEEEEEAPCESSGLPIIPLGATAALIIISFCAYRCLLSRPDHNHKQEQPKHEEPAAAAPKSDGSDLLSLD